MNENLNCWIDENENYWDKNKYSKEEAIKLSETIVNCRKCLNCYNLYNCDSCSFCNDCTNCIDCVGCSNTKDSQGCKYTHESVECFHCIECKKCKKCRSCVDCESCFNCEEAEQSYFLSNCKKCVSCKNLKFCDGLKNCENFLCNPESYCFSISDISYSIIDETDSVPCGTIGTGFKRSREYKHNFCFYFYFDTNNIFIWSDLTENGDIIKSNSFEDLYSRVEKRISLFSSEKLTKEFNDKFKKAKEHYFIYIKMEVK